MSKTAAGHPGYLDLVIQVKYYICSVEPIEL